MLTLQYIPHHEFFGLDLDQKLKKILKCVKDERIILIDGKLHPSEESELIKKTMEQIDRKFKGIEIASINYDFSDLDLFEKLKKNIANMLLNRRAGFTIVGPATIVKEIRKDPSKIELYTMDKKKK